MSSGIQIESLTWYNVYDKGGITMFGSLLWALGIIAAVWVIYDVFVNNAKLKRNNEKKLIWTICAVLFSIVTAIVYYFVYKRK